MLVDRIGVDERDGESVLRARVSPAGRGLPRFELEYAFPGVAASSLSGTGDSFVPALLLPAMALGEDLEVEATLSARLLAGAATAIDIYKAWRPRVSRVQVAGRSESPQTGAGVGVGLNFTCGVDSFYSLLKSDRANDRRAPPVTHLVFTHNFELEPQDARSQAATGAMIERVARESGKRAVIVKSNLRQRVEPVAPLDMHQGAALASVALSLPGIWNRCLIASSWFYGNLKPWGTHPLLDPLWSTEAVELVHHGAEARRSDKVREISGSALALDHLRACWRPLRGTVNCGHCDKCITTMVLLESEGALRRSRAFPQSLDVEKLRSLRFERSMAVDVLGQLLPTLRMRGDRPELADALAVALRRSRRRMRLRSIAERGARAARRRLRAATRRPKRSGGS